MNIEVRKSADVFLDIYWSDLTDCARAQTFAALMTAGIKVPERVLESEFPLNRLVICADEWESE